MDPRTAVRTIIAGVPVHAIPQEDHAAYVDYLSRFANSAEFDSLPQWSATLIASLLQQHQQMLAMQQAQGGTAAGPGQGNNVPTGITQNGGTDLNALEGGVQ